MSEEKTLYLTPDENNVWHEAEIIEVDMNNIGEALTKAFRQGREKAVENYCWLKCKCNGKGCVGTPDECFTVATLKCDKLILAEQIGAEE